MIASMVKTRGGVVDVYAEGTDGYFEFDSDEVLSTHYSSELLELILWCMEPVPSDRPTLPEVMQDIRKHGHHYEHGRFPSISGKS